MTSNAWIPGIWAGAETQPFYGRGSKRHRAYRARRCADASAIQARFDYLCSLPEDEFAKLRDAVLAKHKDGAP